MIPDAKLRKEIAIPNGVQMTAGDVFIAKGPKGEVKRTINEPSVKIEIDGNKVILSPTKNNKQQKITINTCKSHINNMIKGVQEGFEYKLKVCSSHFPMSVTIEGNTVVVKNFLGEKVARKAPICPNTKVAVQGDVITVSGPDLEAVSQTAANIEQSTRITNRDRRVFQDGVWIISKAGKEIGK